MALKPETAFPGKTDGVQAGYPQGKARNITTPGDGTGTPWIADLVNDLWGYLQALLTEAGVAPNETPDSTLDSQYLESARKVYGGTYETRDLLAAAVSPRAGQFITTQGKASPNDGEMGFYRIVASGTGTADDVNFIDLPNADGGAGLQAELIRYPTDNLSVVEENLLATLTADAWQGTTAYTQGLAVHPTLINGFFYEATGAGTTGASEPTWPVVEGTTVGDGTVTWTARKAVSLDQISILAAGTTKRRTLENRFNDGLNVLDFGAVGDGVAEDAAPFTAAEAAGDTVIVPDGAYKVNGTGYGTAFVHDGGATITGTNDLVLRERHVRRYRSQLQYPPEVVAQMGALLPNIYETASGYKTDFDPKSRLPTRALTYYVDPRAGSDINAGTSEATAFATLAHALGLPGDKEIILAPARYNLTVGWNELNIAQGVTVRCDKGRATLTTELRGRDWTEDPTYPGMYSAPTVSGSEDWSAVSLFASHRPDKAAYPLGSKLSTRTIVELQGGAVGINKGAVITQVRLPDDDHPLTGLVVRKQTSNVQATFSSAQELYLENLDIDFGSTNAVRIVCSVACDVTLVNVHAVAGFPDDGIYISNPGTTVTWNVSVGGSWTDGISYHGGVTSQVFEYRGRFINNGEEQGGNNNNGTTIHDGGIIRVGSVATGNQNRNCHDVGISGVSYSYNVGCVFRDSRKGFAGYAVDFGSATGGTPVGTRGWLVDCEVDIVEVLGGLAIIEATVDTTYSAATTVDGGTFTPNKIY